MTTMKTRKVEFLVAFGGPGVGTWDIFEHDVPEEEMDDGTEKILQWFDKNYLEYIEAEFNVAHVAVYHIGSNEDEDT